MPFWPVRGTRPYHQLSKPDFSSLPSTWMTSNFSKGNSPFSSTPLKVYFALASSMFSFKTSVSVTTITSSYLKLRAPLSRDACSRRARHHISLSIGDSLSPSSMSGSSGSLEGRGGTTEPDLKWQRRPPGLIVALVGESSDVTPWIRDPQALFLNPQLGRPSSSSPRPIIENHLSVLKSSLFAGSSLLKATGGGKPRSFNHLTTASVSNDSFSEAVTESFHFLESRISSSKLASFISW
mmetsp:Transcript_15554/g.38361  ORF Transcript_15554/g.38361 Transcript_15554/m.38361 type:complete len:238 (+) Transcript_15554:1732-2445(+)